MNKELKKILKAAEAAGWRTKETRSGMRLLAPDGVTTANFHWGQNDPRANKNLVAAIRRVTPNFMR